MKRLTPLLSLLVLSLSLLLPAVARADDEGRVPREPEQQDTSQWDDWDWGWEWANGGAPAPSNTCTKQSCRACTPNIFRDIDECQLVSRNDSCACAPFNNKSGRLTCRLEGTCTWVQRG